MKTFVLIPGAVDGLRQLQAAGYLLVVITNQSGIARGLYTEPDYLELTRDVRMRLFSQGVRLEAVEHCPHLPDAPVERYRLDCDCRKPRPGMIQRACLALNIDPGASILVGDRVSDVEAGRRAGVGRCLLTRSGHCLNLGDEVHADGVYDDLAACADHLFGKGAQSPLR